LSRADAQLPARAPRAWRDGARQHVVVALVGARARALARGVRRRAVAARGDPAEARAARCAQRSGARVRVSLRMAGVAGRRLRARDFAVEGTRRRTCERRRLRMSAMLRGDGLYSRNGDRAPLARRAHPVDRRRRDRSDARGSREAPLSCPLLLRWNLPPHPASAPWTCLAT